MRRRGPGEPASHEPRYRARAHARAPGAPPDLRVAEALEFASHLGIDAAALASAIEGGPLDAPIADAKLHKMDIGDFAPEFPLEWALKDVDLAIEAAGGDHLPLLEALSRQWRAAVNAGHGRQDVSAVRLALRERQ
jgi:3-hydroxyisobutyrate dehydrogenase